MQLGWDLVANARLSSRFTNLMHDGGHYEDDICLTHTVLDNAIQNDQIQRIRSKLFMVRIERDFHNMNFNIYSGVDKVAKVLSNTV